MNTQDYLNAVREKLQLPSDYALQTPLGLTKQQLSRYRTGKDSLSDDLAIRVAAILEKPAYEVFVDMHVEKAKSPEARASWTALMEKISKSFKDLLPGFGPRQHYV